MQGMSKTPAPADAPAAPESPERFIPLADGTVLDLKTVGEQRPDGRAEAARCFAEGRLKPALQAASALSDWGERPTTLHSGDVMDALNRQADAVISGDLSRLEGMLTIHAHTLDSMFNHLARKAAQNRDGGYLDAFERYFKLALKAQSQCRSTIESLAEIKNPKAVAFVQQANISAGHQQVNNGVSGPARAGARTGAEKPNPANELLEAIHGNKLEHNTQGQARFSDQSLASVGEVHGAEVRRGQGSGGQE